MRNIYSVIKARLYNTIKNYGLVWFGATVCHRHRAPATLCGELFRRHNRHGTAQAKTVAATSRGEQPNTDFSLWLPNFCCGELWPQTKHAHSYHDTQFTQIPGVKRADKNCNQFHVHYAQKQTEQLRLHKKT